MSKRRFRVNITKQLPFHLHNVPDWIEGEYVWSYVGRLAESNGFNDITVFLNRIFALKSETEWKRFMKWGYDIDRPCIQDLFEIEGRDHWIVEMTLFPVLLPFFSRGYQDNKIRAYTEDYERDASRMINRPHSDVKKLRICPKCMKSDIEDGFFYYHLLHQMPGLSTCPLHGCPLMEYSGEIGREANTWSFVPVENSHTAPGYADICLGMTEYPADISAQDTISAIIKQLEKRYGTTQKKELASSVKSDISFSSYQAESKLIRYMLRSTNQNELPAETAINCISLLFESWEDFLDMLPESRSYEEAFKKAIAGEFSMLGHYRNSFVNVKCDFCGHIFPATPLSLIMEAGCPVCNQQLSNKEIFERMFNAASQGEWEYEGDFISMGKPIIFIDKKKQSRILPYDTTDFHISRKQHIAVSQLS